MRVELGVHPAQAGPDPRHRNHYKYDKRVCIFNLRSPAVNCKIAMEDFILILIISFRSIRPVLKSILFDMPAVQTMQCTFMLML